MFFGKEDVRVIFEKRRYIGIIVGVIWEIK